MVIYCDSVILMYYFDYSGPFNIRAANRLTALAAAGDQCAVSDLVRLECRVKPIKVGNAAKLAVFDAFFARPDVQLIPITSATYDRATLIRATYYVGTKDNHCRGCFLECGGSTPLWMFFWSAARKHPNIQSGVEPPHSKHPKRRRAAALQKATTLVTTICWRIFRAEVI